MEENIRTWYLETYPTDDLGEQLSDVSFKEFLGGVAANKTYETMGVGDSLIRERLFEKLAAILQKPYSYIYDLWLSGALKEVA